MTAVRTTMPINADRLLAFLDREDTLPCRHHARANKGGAGAPRGRFKVGGAVDGYVASLRIAARANRARRAPNMIIAHPESVGMPPDRGGAVTTV